MIDDDGSVEIEVPDDVVVPPVIEKVVDKPAGEAERPEVTAEEGIDIVKANLLASQENERTLRGQLTEAQRATSEITRVADAARGETHEAQLTLVNNAIAQLDERKNTAKANYAAAMAGGNFEAAADYQEVISEATAQLVTLRSGAEQLKNAAPQPVEIRKQPVDPVEALALQMQPKSAAWIRQHPEFVTDQRLYQKMIGAHNLVTGDGVQPDTPEYFEKIETLLGVRQAEAAPAPEPKGGRQAAPAAAPVSRGTSIANGGDGQRTVRLTADEREMAKLSGMTDLEYAQQKLRVESERATQH